jgi:hypothetical protein
VPFYYCKCIFVEKEIENNLSSSIFQSLDKFIFSLIFILEQLLNKKEKDCSCDKD